MKPFLFPFALRRRDLPGIVAGLILLAVVLFVSLRYPDGLSALGPGWKFGAGWTCQHIGQGEPICIKDVPKAPPR